MTESYLKKILETIILDALSKKTMQLSFTKTFFISEDILKYLINKYNINSKFKISNILNDLNLFNSIGDISFNSFRIIAIFTIIKVITDILLFLLQMLI